MPVGLFWAAIVGNVLKNFDLALLGLIAPFIAPLFFPTNDPLTALILTYALIPIGFISKPIGAYFFGRLGDHWGRRSALMVTSCGMGITTGLMGCLPTYDHVGAWAPIFLALGRVLQNFFAAGESTGGSLLLIESTALKKRSLMSSLYDASSIMGILVASLSITCLGFKGMMEQGWRYLYLFGFLSAVLGVVIRYHVDESKDFKLASETKPMFSPRWRRHLICIVFATGFTYLTYSIPLTLMNGFLPLISSVTREEAIALNTILLGVDLCLLPLFGYMAMRIKKEKLMVFAALSVAILAVPLWNQQIGGGIWPALVFRTVIVTLGALFAAPFHYWSQDGLNVKERYTVIAMGKSIGSQIIGYPAPAICLLVYQKTGWAYTPALFLVVTALMGAGSVIFRNQLLFLEAKQKC